MSAVADRARFSVKVDASNIDEVRRQIDAVNLAALNDPDLAPLEGESDEDCVQRTAALREAKGDRAFARAVDAVAAVGAKVTSIVHPRIVTRPTSPVQVMRPMARSRERRGGRVRRAVGRLRRSGRAGPSDSDDAEPPHGRHPDDLDGAA